MTPNLTDDEIDDICAGLVQSAAKIRFLTTLGLHCLRKPNGSPLVNRAHFDRVMGSPEKAHTGKSTGPVWGVH